MTEKAKNIIYTAEDIEKYLSGKMNAQEMHALEKAALDDPLLSEAIEGYQSTQEKGTKVDFETIRKNLSDIRKEISNKGISSPRSISSINSWLKIAAAILLLALVSITAKYFIGNNNDQPKNIAQNKSVVQSNADNTITDTVKILPETGNATVVKDKPVTVPDKTAEKKNIEIPGASVLKEAAAAEDLKENNMAYQNDETISAPAAKANQEKDAFELNNNLKKAKQLPNVLQKRESSLFFKGKVTDNKGNPVPFATLVINKKRQTKTDGQGYFSIPSNDSTAILNVIAMNYSSKETKLSAYEYKKIILENGKINFNNNAGNKITGQVRLVYKHLSEPKDGWTKYLLHLTMQISDSQYDTGEKVTGETLVNFEIDNTGEPVNFSFEKSINIDVDEAIKDLIINGPEWKPADQANTNGTVTLQINF